MNTVTRVYGRQYARKAVNRAYFSLTSISIGLFAFSVLLSAFGVLYARDLNRRLFIQYQTLQGTQQYYQTQWSQLLLEQGAWSTQVRIQRLAQKRLNMVTPASEKIVFLEYRGKTLADNK